MPRMHQLPRRIDLEIFSLHRIGLAARNAGTAPAAAEANVAAPFFRVEHAGIDPPLDDLARSHRLEDAFRRPGDLDGADDRSVDYIGDGASIRFDLAHFSSRLRFSRCRLACQNAR